MKMKLAVYQIITVLVIAQLKLVNAQKFDDDYDFELKKNILTGDLRFNKFWFKSRNMNSNIKPLKANDYPITGFVNETLRESNAYSVITPDDYEVVYNVPKIIEAIGGLPPQPSANPNSKFWDMLREVMNVQEIRLNNPNAKLFPRPDNWKNNDLNEVAEYVHNEVGVLLV